MGGMIAQLCALDHPERVSKLVLVGTHFGGASVVHPKPEIAAVLQPSRGTPFDEITRTALQLITAPGFAAHNPELIERFVARAVAAPTRKAAFSAQLAALLSSDRSRRVHSLRMPTLVVHGELDPLIPVDNGIALARSIPGARLEILRGVGHLPNLEAPARMAGLVNDFLSL
jgi:pimeloyl-ACP methyl ester carboxylesterase